MLVMSESIADKFVVSEESGCIWQFVGEKEFLATVHCRMQIGFPWGLTKALAERESERIELSANVSQYIMRQMCICARSYSHCLLPKPQRLQTTRHACYP